MEGIVDGRDLNITELNHLIYSAATLTSYIVYLTPCFADTLPSTALDNHWSTKILTHEDKCLFLMYFWTMNSNMFPEFSITHTFCVVSENVTTRAYICKSLGACKSTLDTM